MKGTCTYYEIDVLRLSTRLLGYLKLSISVISLLVFSMFGDSREMELHYFLADDTVEIVERIPNNSGRDAVPMFLRRQRLPKVSKALDLFSTLCTMKCISDILFLIRYQLSFLVINIFILFRNLHNCVNQGRLLAELC